MTVPDFDLRVVRGDSRMRIAPVGELDIATSPQLEEAIARATSEPVSELVLDLRELTFMDSTGLRVMVSADARARDDSRRLAIVQGPEAVHRVFRITGLDDHLDIVDTPEAAVSDAS